MWAFGPGIRRTSLSSTSLRKGTCSQPSFGWSRRISALSISEVHRGETGRSCEAEGGEEGAPPRRRDDPEPRDRDVAGDPNGRAPDPCETQAHGPPHRSEGRHPRGFRRAEAHLREAGGGAARDDHGPGLSVD